MNFAVGQERVGDHAVAGTTKEFVGREDVARGIGVNRDDVEVALSAGLIHTFQERVVVAGQTAHHDCRVRFSRLDCGIRRLQQFDVGAGVRVAPPRRGVLLVPDLVGGHLRPEVPGDHPEQRGVVLGSGRRRVFVA
jgi:hypothetical protein